MRRTSRLAHVVAVGVFALGACTSAPDEKSIAGPPPSPIVTTDPAGLATGDAASVGATGASAPRSGEIQPSTSTTPRELPPGDLQTAHARPAASQSGSDKPRTDAPKPVGPAASYDDAADDAHGGSHVEPVSQPSFDILHVAWNPVSYDEEGRRGYSTSITIAGPAREDGAYVSFGYFSDVSGDDCQLYNILELGTPAYAHAFCGSIADGTRRFLGRMNGRPVTSSPTAAGGTTLVGTFDDPAVDAALEAADRTLYSLSAFSAMCSPSPDECETYAQEWDRVTSALRFRV